MRTRSQLLKQLAETRRQIEHGDNIIGAQQRLIAKLSMNGHDATLAEELLDSFEHSQEIRLGEMDRLLNTLDTMPAEQDVRKVPADKLAVYGRHSSLTN